MNATHLLAVLTVLAPATSTQEGAPEDAAVRAPARPAAELYALFDYDADADLEVEERGIETFTGYSRLDVTYASPMGGRVPAYIYEPEGEGPFAGIVLMHGMPGDRSNSAALAELYVRAGATVLAISAPWARPDGAREDIVTFGPSDRDEQIQLIQDLRRGVDLLQSFPWVDAERIGYSGGSYGGAMGGLLAGVEGRIKAYALMVGDGGLVAHFTGHGDPEGPPEGVSKEKWQAWLDAMNPIEPIRFVPYAKSPLLFQNGEVDPMVPAPDARAYQEAACEPKTIKWYPGGHSITGDMLRDQQAWMAEHLGIGRPE